MIFESTLSTVSSDCNVQLGDFLGEKKIQVDNALGETQICLKYKHHIRSSFLVTLFDYNFTMVLWDQAAMFIGQAMISIYPAMESISQAVMFFGQAVMFIGQTNL